MVFKHIPKTEEETTVKVSIKTDEQQTMDKITSKGMGRLDMVIAFDTTGSMCAYIDDVRKQVVDMIPRLFKDNSDLNLGIVAFGDYCDMPNATRFGNAYQCIPLTDNENMLIEFVKRARNTSGGDGDEFYELVLQKIIDEMPWREGASKAILLIADADPHPIGYSYDNYVVNNQIDWRVEAQRAAKLGIRIDTVSIRGARWYQELADMTNGICIPFKSSNKTAVMIETAATARSVMSHAEHRKAFKINEMNRDEINLRSKLADMMIDNPDEEISEICCSFREAIDKNDKEE